MELELLNSEKNLLEFEIINERHTLTNLLKAKLLENPEVSFAAYTLTHPMDTKAKFVLRTKSKSPKKILEDACAQINEDLNDFEKAFKKALK